VGDGRLDQRRDLRGLRELGLHRDRAAAGLRDAPDDLVRVARGLGVVDDDGGAGRLVPLLKSWWPVFPGCYLSHSTRTHVPRKLRAFIDFMMARCNA